MGLTKRKGTYYIEFNVWDDGKTLRLARHKDRKSGARLQRWCTGTGNKTMAQKQQDLKKVDLMKGIEPSRKVNKEGPKTFESLAVEYLADPKIKRQASYQKKAQHITDRFMPHFGSRTPLPSITQEDIESYLEMRRIDKSRNGTPPKVATLNRELAGLKHLFSWAVKKGYLSLNPSRYLYPELEDNVRDEILDEAEFHRLQSCSPAWLKPINLVAYYTAMRRGEILGLTWAKIDLKKGFIRLTAEDTKTKEGRAIPLTFSLDLVQTFRELFRERPLHTDRVFLRAKKPVSRIRAGFDNACRKAGLRNFRFHDFRHTAITNMRRAGIDPLTIMKISGHKTMICFKRYNSFREPDLLAAANQYHTYTTLGQNAPSSTLPDASTKSVASY